MIGRSKIAEIYYPFVNIGDIFGNWGFGGFYLMVLHPRGFRPRGIYLRAIHQWGIQPTWHSSHGAFTPRGPRGFHFRVIRPRGFRSRGWSPGEARPLKMAPVGDLFV